MSRVMKTTPGMACLKFLLGVFTGILWIIGACILGAGIYSKIELGDYDLLTTINYSSAPYVMIGIGVFIVLIGFLGCCAMVKGNTCLLRSYGFTLVVIFVAEIALALVVVVFRTKIQESFDAGMTEAIKKYNETAYKDAINQAQSTLGCCGSNNYTDYWVVANFAKNTVPSSCCKNQTLCKPKESKGILTLPTTNVDDYIHVSGCPVNVFEVVNKNLGIILGVLFGVAAFQIIGVILSCCLASSINSNKYELV